MILPEPGKYMEWSSWAKALLSALNPQGERAFVSLREFSVGTLPPANQDGLVIWVVDTVDGALPLYSKGGEWLRFDTNAVPLYAYSMVAKAGRFKLTGKDAGMEVA